MPTTTDYILSYLSAGRHLMNSELSILKDLVHTLSKEELASLLARIGRKSAIYEEVQDMFHRNGSKPAKDERVTELLRWFYYKQSGKTREARKELREKFRYAAYEDQEEIVKAFLSGGKDDRRWIYLRMAHLVWSDAIYDMLKTLWEKYHEELCGEIVSHFPHENRVWREESKEEAEEMDNQEIAPVSLYPKEEEEDRDFRTLHLHSIDDLERPMDGEKANAILYKEVAKFLNSSDHYLLPRFRNDYSATMMYEVNIILWCMGEIGLSEQIIAFLEWDRSVNRMMQELLGEKDTNDIRKTTQRKETRQNKQQQWETFCYCATKRFPEPYRSFLKYPIQDERLTNMIEKNPSLATLISSCHLEEDNNTLINK